MALNAKHQPIARKVRKAEKRRGAPRVLLHFTSVQCSLQKVSRRPFVWRPVATRSLESGTQRSAAAQRSAARSARALSRARCSQQPRTPRGYNRKAQALLRSRQGRSERSRSRSASISSPRRLWEYVHNSMLKSTQKPVTEIVCKTLQTP